MLLLPIGHNPDLQLIVFIVDLILTIIFTKTSHNFLLMSEAFLALGPNFNEIFENLQLLHNGWFRLQVMVITGVQHEDRGEADGQVVRVHLVSGALGGHRSEVIKQMNKAVLKSN